MGKKIIIPGADFSVNGIASDAIVLYGEMDSALNVQVGIKQVSSALVTEENQARACVFGLDLSYYYGLGYRHVRVYFAQDYKGLLALGESTTAYQLYDTDGNVRSWGWNDPGVSLQGPIGADDLMFVNIKRADDGVISSSLSLDSFITSVELW